MVQKNYAEEYIREKRKISVAKVAKELKISRQTVYNILAGKKISRKLAELVEHWSDGEIPKEQLIGW